MSLASCISCSKGCAILSFARRNSPLIVVAHTGFCGWFVCFLHVCRYWQQQAHRKYLTFHNSPNHSLCVTLPKVGGTGLNLTAVNRAVITQKFWVLNKQCQVFAQVVRLGQNRVPHTWLLNPRSNGYDNRASDLHTALWSGSNESPAWSDEPTKHHDNNDIPDSRVLSVSYPEAYGAWRLYAVIWWGWMIIIRTLKLRYATLNIPLTQSHQLMQNR